MPWDDTVKEYTTFKESVKSLAFDSIRSIKVTLKQFRQLHWPTQKDGKRPVVALKEKQLINLLIAAKRYERYGDAWFIRVLLAVSTGLRRGDIERLLISDVDIESSTVNTYSQKTGKDMPNRPLHPQALTALSKYIAEIPPGQSRLLPDQFTSDKWDRIRKNAGLRTFKFHDLRRTFASLIAQQGFSTSVTQDLLEHSTSKLTHDVYTDVEPVYRKAVDSIPLPFDDVIQP